MPRTTSRPGSFGLGILILLLLPAALRAQEASEQDCATALQEAEKAYLDGPVEKVPEILRKPCLRGRASREEKAKAYGLLARAYVILDRRSKARTSIETLLTFDPGFKPDRLSDPVPFTRLVEEVKAAQGAVVTVASVSKADEPLNEAPATVVVVTAEQIAHRGYTDLEQIFHDLPGFDVSRSNGQTYSNLYQRGFRSNNTDRTLFLIDGVEQNDLWSNIAYISRQYPLSNIEQIEVVYGPASTIYGANAYAGVVNVITRQPSDYFTGEDENKSFQVTGQVAGGSFGTRFFEANLAGRVRNLSYSLTGRLFRSDERDLAAVEDPRFADWNFDPADFMAVDYESVMTVSGLDKDGNYRAQTLFEAETVIETFLGELTVGDFLRSLCFDLMVCTVRRADGTIVTSGDELTDVAEIVPNEILTGVAMSEDMLGYTRLFPFGELADPEFSDITDDWSIGAKLKLPNLELGLHLWQREEGSAAAFSDLFQSAAFPGLTQEQDSPGTFRGPYSSRWTPRSLSFHLKYSRPVGTAALLQVFSRYKVHELADPSSTVRYRGFATGDFGIQDILVANPQWFAQFFNQSSTQLRNEITLVYRPRPTFSLVSGVELRHSTIQMNLDSNDRLPVVGEGSENPPAGLRTRLSSTDAGLYLQGSYKPWSKLRLVAGGRVDHNEVREAPGYGTVFNPRLGVIYLPAEGLTVKAIYSEAFKDPSTAEKFGTVVGINEAQSAGLDPERVSNFEVSALWQREAELNAGEPSELRKQHSLELAAYESDYSNIVTLQNVPHPRCDPFCGPTGQQKNLGRLRVHGVQLAGSWHVSERLEVAGNYNFTDPVNTSSEVLNGPGRVAGSGSVRVGDIASQRLNLELNAALPRNLDLNLRMNHVGARKTGPGTTVASNLLGEVAAYTVFHAAVTYDRLPLPGARGKLQLVATNLLDEDYDHPGVAQAGRVFSARLPQNGRAVFLRLSLSY